MKKKNLPVKIKDKSRPLWNDILKFSRKKFSLAFILVLIGLLGIVIPVIPGFLFIFFAVAFSVEFYFPHNRRKTLRLHGLAPSKNKSILQVRSGW